ncbi:hypothetical protein C5E07_11455 [Pseudoclavibacter sp. RFBJ3]|uniref:hypothetical protein n=1 Tax=unclassified Pseudoclavibacter TaxID=2615177 RepID=UPI000CE8EA3B|nr:MULTISPECIES: hypothetical protein [unclassified Pseudoclavibacter]PPF83302.1 hypothetical protein C5C12_10530 [Pseudoclavibacter sp. RFBJ5]PPF91844.1 hypothetical protein C5E07_11455 [Pseudoclavibacter sp. RFBJ3]PPG01108.1 hypothetical protein C5C19_00500 [Pseudoclavibacter sp. RFBH5]PPG26211.1 hypothetical protein C5E13_00455 [Pseudoclavibacter sp. RFBI4]
MAEEGDGIEEAFEGQMRVLVTAAGRVGESFARGREEAKRRALERSQREARELESRLEAERRAAHAEFGNVYRNEWWDKATPQDIGNTYQNARAWSNEDPEAVRAEARMRDELRSRYGIDVDNTRADPAAVREAVERAEQNRGQSDAERQRSAAEKAEADRLLHEADRADNAAERSRTEAGNDPDAEQRHEERVQAEQRQALADAARDAAQPLYDSAERRDATAVDLESKGVSPEAVSAKMRADVSQGKPATEAVKGPVGKSPKARNSRGRTPQAQRSEPSR